MRPPSTPFEHANAYHRLSTLPMIAMLYSSFVSPRLSSCTPAQEPGPRYTKPSFQIEIEHQASDAPTAYQSDHQRPLVMVGLGRRREPREIACGGFLAAALAPTYLRIDHSPQGRSYGLC